MTLKRSATVAIDVWYRCFPLLFVFLQGCGSSEPGAAVPDRRIETFEDRIREVHKEEGGAVILGLDLSARWHRIDPDRSPDFADLVELAHEARASRRPVKITIDATGTATSKTPPRADDPKPPRLPVVLRLLYAD